MSQTTANALTAAGFLAIVLLCLLAVAERVGLPLPWVKALLTAVMLLTLALVLTLSRTATERTFAPRSDILSAFSGGIVLTLTIGFLLRAIIAPATPPEHAAAVGGAIAGIVMAQPLLRLLKRRLAWDDREPRFGAQIKGLALLLLGGGMLIAGLGVAAAEATRMFGLSAEAAMASMAVVALAAVLFGGGQGATVLAAALATVATLTIVVAASVGAIQFGQPPLPGLAEPQTLMAVADARQAWGITHPPHLTRWPDWRDIAAGASLRVFGLAALIGAGISIACAPAIPTHRKGVSATAAVGCVILPLALMAIAGFAVEAAAIRFIGAPTARPPQELIDASRLGLISVCGAFPETADALRAACGVGPRDPAMLAWQQLRPTQPYIEQGPMAALGYPAAMAIAAGSGQLAAALGAAVLGLWLAAEGLGRRNFASGAGAAGLASLRLGLTRLAAVLVAAAAVALQSAHIELPRAALPAALAAGSALLAMGLIAALLRPEAVPSPTPPAAIRAPRRRKAGSSAGEAA